MRARLVVFGVVAACVAFAMVCGSALALTGHVLSSTVIGSSGSGAGQVSLQAAAANVSGSEVAVNSTTHDLYVADTGNRRVDEFEANGTFVQAWGWETDGLPGFGSCTLLTSCQAGSSGSAPGQFVQPVFVAVDNSGGPSQGDVYVGDVGDSLVSKFSASGALIESWGVNGQLAGSGSEAFGELAGIAVGGDGALSVLNKASRLFRFEESGVFVSETSVARETEPKGLAVDAQGSAFKINRDESVEDFAPGGSDVGQVTPNEFESRIATAMAVDGGSGGVGDLFVAEAGLVRHYGFAGQGVVAEPGGKTCVVEPHTPCPATDSFGAEELTNAGGVGVDGASGEVYVADAGSQRIAVFSAAVVPGVVETLPASELAPESARLNGMVDPEGVALSECVFEYVAEEAYAPSAKDPYEAGGVAACESPDASEVPADSSEHEVHADIAGLSPGVVYHYRLRAANSAPAPAFGQDVSAQTPPPPSIDSATVTQLGRSSAVLNAKIDPQGASTHYRFEYGTTTSYGIRVPALESEEENIGAGSSDVTVSKQIGELHENTTYHWRVAATNPSGTTLSPDHTFVYTTTGASLPDHRAYEMVTPTHKNGALISDVPFLGQDPEISKDGSRLFAMSIQCFAEATSCQAHNGNSIGSPYEFERHANGWVTTPLAPPVTQYPASTLRAYSPTRDAVLFSMATPPFGEDDFYIREPTGGLVDLGPNTPPEQGELGPRGGKMDDRLQVNTSDFRHFVWDAIGTEERWPFDATVGEQSVYEYSESGAGNPLLVGVTGGEGSRALVSVCGTALGSWATNGVPGMMSSNGQIVFFTAHGGEACHGTEENQAVPVPVDTLYARVDGEGADAHSVDISSPAPSECGSGGAPGEQSCRAAIGTPAAGSFVGASSDGSKAFFFSTQQLTDSASEDSAIGDSAVAGCEQTVGTGGCNLYEYDLANPKGQNLIDVSGGDTSGGGPRTQGVMALSEDGSHVYFVAKGVLTTTPNDQGQSARNGANNLYVFERDGAFPAGRTRFIAALPTSDAEEWTTSPGYPANVTPDGRVLVFLSHGDLTADDTSVSGARQVFRYDAMSGRLNRVSIGSEGFNDNGNRSIATSCNSANKCVEDASIVVGKDSHERHDPTMSDDGSRVFFTSPVGLTAQALDDVPINGSLQELQYAENVYEWEQEGVGSCPAGRPQGCVFLISDGRDIHMNVGGANICTTAATCLWGTDVTGNNVFFATADQLVGSDTNTEVDVYDARVCEAASPCVSEPPPPPLPCLGEACHGTPAGVPPVLAAPTVTFDGQVNLAPPPPSKRIVKCVKGKRVARGRCVKIKPKHAKHRKTGRRVRNRRGK